MKYLKLLIENQQIQDYINNLSINIDIDDFCKKKESQIYENLDLFITLDLNKSYYNIRNFIVTETISYINEITLKAIGLGTVAVGSIYLYKQLESFWDSTLKPIKSFFVNVDDHLINNIKSSSPSEDLPFFQKSIDSIFSPTEFSFLNSPLFILFLLAGSYYSGSKLINNYSTIRKIASMKESFDAIYARLDALGVKEALPAKQFNEEKYNNHLTRCRATGEKTFNAMTINIGCPLDAYLTYCSSMILSLAGIYLSTLKERVYISSMMNLLSVKENFMINQLLTSMYNQFSSALEFIYIEDPSIKQKWLSMLDKSIVDLSKTTQTSTQAIKQVFSQNKVYDRSSNQRFNR